MRKRTLTVDGKTYVYYSLHDLEFAEPRELAALPFSIKVLLEAAIRQCDGKYITRQHVKQLAQWKHTQWEKQEIPFKPARIVFQDFTGVPAIVDLAAMREAVQEAGGDPLAINPQIPVDLVIDHSLIVEHAGSNESFARNLKLEYERNRERYQFIRWAQKAFQNFRVVPPASGIVHQVNLEALATLVRTKEEDGSLVVFPDSVVGTDSHTPMINGLGIVGWGVGGIEAEAAMLGQPLYFVMPQVVGVKLTGSLAEGATATDLALTITNMLRQHGVVGKFVEFFGPGLKHLPLADRATIANMAPEYGATMGFFPADEVALDYLRLTGRGEVVPLAEAYLKAQGLFRTDDTPSPQFTEVLELDLSSVRPVLAGPKRPQDRIELTAMKQAFAAAVSKPVAERGYGLDPQELEKKVALPRLAEELATGAVVLAAITSCTNTSNPSVMIAAGLLAKKAVQLGLRTPAYVKTTLTPGSTVVAQYLREAGLLDALEQLGFYIDGYGCATCCGNSGSLHPEVEEAIKANQLLVASVLSGNRNFEGRVHPLIKANYLASPPLVIAYALAGTVRIDFQAEPIGYGRDSRPVYLRDIWPSPQEVADVLAATLRPELFRQQYENMFENESWASIDAPEGIMYKWDPQSTYIQKAPYFSQEYAGGNRRAPLTGLKALLVLGDSITTDHISPAGRISPGSPAALYLAEKGVAEADFNSYGTRRGNHHVMMRGTFANIRIRNRLADGREGGYTKYLPSGEIMPVYDAAMKYKQDGTGLLVIAGKEYGTGSSRDWAAKGTYLLGIKAVLAESFERIHRSNLVGMGVLPLQFVEGDSADSLQLDGTETFAIIGLENGIDPGQHVTVRAVKADQTVVEFRAIVRLDSTVEVEYYKNGGILQTVLRSYVS
ncbi:aconitate hydratase AcnA [Brevibacillus marinus]|uniref:aconitate hydratase AcnA n=1 Tax=Brevibacillus marinus TaxID=2496837 RepID=UPI000F84C74D|nr:aconitate hydratase AcnA [Brevibacillus marinus]